MSNRRRPATDLAACDAQAHGGRSLPPHDAGRSPRSRVEPDAVSILGAVTAERQAAAGRDRERSGSRSLPTANRSRNPALILLLIGAMMLLVAGYRLTTREPVTTKASASNPGVTPTATAPVQVSTTPPVSPAPGTASIETIEPAASLQRSARAPLPSAEQKRSWPTPTIVKAPAGTRPTDTAEVAIKDRRTLPTVPPAAVQAAVAPPARSSKAVVERTAGASTAELVRKCEEFGPLEGLLCRIRICSDLWGVDPACPAQSRPNQLIGDAP